MSESRTTIDDGRGTWRKWMAVRRSDGGSDGRLYATRRKAAAAQPPQQPCTYAQVTVVARIVSRLRQQPREQQ